MPALRLLLLAAAAGLAAPSLPEEGRRADARDADFDDDCPEVVLLQRRYSLWGEGADLGLGPAAESYGLAQCPCVGVAWPDGEEILLPVGNATVAYPLGMGSSCRAWDAGRHPACSTSSPPSWCRRAWCFVDACDCALPTAPRPSYHMPAATYRGRSVHYSYATCGTSDAQAAPWGDTQDPRWAAPNSSGACASQSTTSRCEALDGCVWSGGRGCVGSEAAGCGAQGDEGLFGRAGCRCIGFADVDGFVSADLLGTSLFYPAEVGAYCAAWDNGWHPSCTGADTPASCTARWCLVDAGSCSLAAAPGQLTYFPGATYQGRPLFYSYATCEATGAIANASNASDASSNISDPPNISEASIASNDFIVPSVSNLSNLSNLSSIPVENYGLAQCPCIAIDWPDDEEILLRWGNATVATPLGMGSSCRAWDADRHPACSSPSPPSWCWQAWCYVDPCDCGLPGAPHPSHLLAGATYRGRPLHYSKATCGAPDSWSAASSSSSSGGWGSWQVASNRSGACASQANGSRCEALDGCVWSGERGCTSSRAAGCAARGDEGLFGRAECRCIGFAGVGGFVSAHLLGVSFFYPAKVGAYCAAWDYGWHPSCTGDDTPAACTAHWCLVDALSCNLAVAPERLTYFPGATYQGRPLFYSYATCEVVDDGAGLVNASNASNASNALNSSNASNVVTNASNVVTNASNVSNTSSASIVSNASNASEHLGGGTPVESYGLPQCKCIGIDWPDDEKILVEFGGNMVAYPLGMGSSCRAWDDDRHPACTSPSPPSWCWQDWCFVDAWDCGLPTAPQPSYHLPTATFRGRPVRESYATCSTPEPMALLLNSSGGTRHSGRTASNRSGACAGQANRSRCEASGGCIWSGGRGCIGSEAGGSGALGDEGVFGMAECRCIGFANTSGFVSAHFLGTSLFYPAEVGTYCAAWDYGWHPSCTGDDVPASCTASWCMVDVLSCNLAVAPERLTYFPGTTYRGRPLHYSYATCKEARANAGLANASNASNASNVSNASNASNVSEVSDAGEVVDVDIPVASEASVENYGLAQCPCIGIDWPGGETIMLDFGIAAAAYPLGLGSSCQAWDAQRHPACSSLSPPSWCWESWCFVDDCHCGLATAPQPSYHLSTATYRGRPVHFSYTTCGAPNGTAMLNLSRNAPNSSRIAANRSGVAAANRSGACANQTNNSQCDAVGGCVWSSERGCVDEEADTCGVREGGDRFGRAGCRCIGFAQIDGFVAADVAGRSFFYPAEVGAYCAAWDFGWHPSCAGDDAPASCEASWCLVDPLSCDLAVAPEPLTYFRGATYQGRPLFYSYATCQTAARACGDLGDEASCTQQGHCAWAGRWGCIDAGLADALDAPDIPSVWDDSSRYVNDSNVSNGSNTSAARWGSSAGGALRLWALGMLLLLAPR